LRYGLYEKEKKGTTATDHKLPRAENSNMVFSLSDPETDEITLKGVYRILVSIQSAVATLLAKKKEDVGGHYRTKICRRTEQQRS